LEIVYTSKGYREFESLHLRQKSRDPKGSRDFFCFTGERAFWYPFRFGRNAPLLAPHFLLRPVQRWAPWRWCC